MKALVIGLVGALAVLGGCDADSGLSFEGGEAGDASMATGGDDLSVGIDFASSVDLFATVDMATSATGEDLAMAAGSEVTGTIRGNSFPVSRAYWIGRPDPGSPPTYLFLVEPPLSCADVSIPGWDKPLQSGQVLEIGVEATKTGSYTIGIDAAANYLRAAYNPDATAGTVTLDAINTDKNLVGTFTLTFGADMITGRFDATWCATGVEP